MGTDSDPQRIAKWADKTETIANQIGEAEETTKRITDKAAFILVNPMLKDMPEDVQEQLESKLKEINNKHPINSNTEDSSLNRKLNELIECLRELNEYLVVLCDRIDI